MDNKNGYNEWAEKYDQQINPTRDLEKDVIQKVLNGVQSKTVLDLGCGTGKNVPFLNRIASHYIGFDQSEKMIEIAQHKYSSPSNQFQLLDLNQAWPIESGSVDLICCSLTLEHFEKINFIFSEAFRCLPNAGLFYICELHPFKQYLGSSARFEREGEAVKLQTFTHHISDYLIAGNQQYFKLDNMEEWFDDQPLGKIPRLISFLFKKL